MYYCECAYILGVYNDVHEGGLVCQSGYFYSTEEADYSFSDLMFVAAAYSLTAIACRTAL